MGIIIYFIVPLKTFLLRVVDAAQAQFVYITAWSVMARLICQQNISVILLISMIELEVLGQYSGNNWQESAIQNVSTAQRYDFRPDNKPGVYRS